MPTSDPTRRQPPLEEDDAGAAAVAAPAGLALDVAVAGAEEADAGAAALVGKYSGPFCPQPASSPNAGSSTAGMM
jgi:hypothetical protein